MIRTYPGEPDLAPIAVARAYVDALDRRDGKRFCGLVAPYISGLYELAVRDPESFFHPLRDCPRFVSAYIGYVEDCCPPEFKGADVESAHDGPRHGGLRSIDLEIRVRIVENGKPRVETLRDRVWLARLDGAWRVAKLSAVVGAASLPTMRPRGADEGSNPLAPPDVAAEQRRFATALDEFRRRNARREASYGRPGPPADCSGGLSVVDAEADQDWNGTVPGEPPHVPAGDITKVSVAVHVDEVCVRWDLAGAPKGPLSLNYGHRKGPSNGQFFDVELREDGRVRVTSGEGSDDRPIPVPATVGVDDRGVTVVLDPASFRAGQREWARPEAPPLDSFGISASSVAPAGAGRAVLDSLGTGTAATFRYPDGGRCALQGC